MKYFVAVVDCNSFTEAAEQCYISQSAISQQIRALEDDLGVELIHRENRKFTLTPAGEYFYGQSKVILNEVGDIRRETVRIGKDDDFQNTLGFAGKFLFAENLEEGRLMVAGNRGFLPIESAGTLPPPGAAIKRLPILQNGRRLQRNYCVFWLKEHTNYYIEEFAEILKKLLHKSEEENNG